MGRFSTITRQSKHIKPIYSSDTPITKPDNVLIHIGEKEPFGLHIENLSSYKTLSKTDSSVCILLTYKDSDNDVLTLKWNKDRNIINSRDHLIEPIVNEIIAVPKYRVRELFKHHDTFVLMSIRTYIKGYTLESVYNNLTDDALNIIFYHIRMIVWELSTKKSSYFGHINDGELKTTTALAYMRTHAMFDVASGIMKANDYVQQDCRNYETRPTLCHMNLLPEHIILDGTNVVGIVGWSNADFVPEIYDRISYYLRSDPKDKHNWFYRMSNIVTSDSYRDISAEFVFNIGLYAYLRIIHGRDSSKVRVVMELWRSIRENRSNLSCLLYMPQSGGDNMSQELLMKDIIFQLQSFK